MRAGGEGGGEEGVGHWFTTETQRGAAASRAKGNSPRRRGDAEEGKESGVSAAFSFPSSPVGESAEEAEVTSVTRGWQQRLLP